MREVVDSVETAASGQGPTVLSLILRARPTLLLVLAAVGLAAGALLPWFSVSSWSVLTLIGGAVVVLLALVTEVVFSLRKGEFGGYHRGSLRECGTLVR